jgi:pimeloyl-ACP methyl ester carboxylesterase
MTGRPALLLLPGNMCDARLWAPVAARLEATGRTVRTGDLCRQATIAAMADDMLARHDGPLIPIGFSMGAIVAATMAARAPARLAGLGLIAFNASADLPERAAVRPRQQAEVRAGRLDAIVADELKPNYLAAANREDAALRATVMAMARALGPDVFVTQSEALRTRGDLRPALGRLTMPVLLAAGAEDRLCPPDWHRAWQAAIGPTARLVEIAGAGHLLPLERPDALADALIDWLQEEDL